MLPDTVFGGGSRPCFSPADFETGSGLKPPLELESAWTIIAEGSDFSVRCSLRQRIQVSKV